MRSAVLQLVFVAALRAKMGLPRKTFARLSGFSERAIADWERGKAISEPGLRRMREMERFQERLAEVVSADAIPAWLDLCATSHDAACLNRSASRTNGRSAAVDRNSFTSSRTRISDP